MDTYFDTVSKTALGRPGELCIAAAKAHLADLHQSAAIKSVGAAALVEVDAGDPVTDTALASARVLVLEVDPDQPQTLRRMRNIRDSYPDLKIIAAIAQADVKLVKALIRQGICDVAELPFQPEELATQVLEAASDALDLTNEVPLAPVYAVVRSVGGSGSTSVLTHLAAALVHQDPERPRVCVVDFDLQGGEVAAFVGASAPINLGTLLEAGDRLDDAVVSSAIVETRYGFSVVAAPDAVVPLDFGDPAQINTVMTLLRQRFDFVLIDLPADWTNWSLSIAAEAERVVMVIDSSIASLRQGRRKIDLLESVGVERGAIRLVVNRTERKLFRTVGTDDIAEALRADVIASLGDEGGALRAAQDQGVLLSDSVGRSPYVRTIGEIAARLAAGEL
ncbi:MAG: CpaE family protein [Novosphingobium sp.]